MLFGNPLLNLVLVLGLLFVPDYPNGWSQARQSDAPAIQWAASLEDALKQAKSRNCHLILHYLGAWDSRAGSPALRIYESPELAAFSQKHVVYRTYAGRDDAARNVAERYRPAAIPVFFILDGDGNELDRINGYREGAELAAGLQSRLDDPSAFGRLLKAEQAGTLSPDGQLHLIRCYRYRLNYAECLKRIQEAKAQLEAWPIQARRDFTYLSSSCFLESAKPAEALSMLDEFQRVSESDERTETARLMRAEALIDLAQYSAASAVLATLDESTLQEVAVYGPRLAGRIPSGSLTGNEGFWTLYKQSTQALGLANTSEALQTARQALEVAPLRGDTHLLLARIYAESAAKSTDPIVRARELQRAFEELWICRRVDPWNLRTHEPAGLLANQWMTAPQPGAFGKARPSIATLPATQIRRRQNLPQLEELLAAMATDPDDPLLWRCLEILGESFGTPLERHADAVPFELLSIPQEGSVEASRFYPRVPAETVGAWKEYARARQMLQTDGVQRSREAKTVYRLTAAEETRALEAAISWWSSERKKDSSLKNSQLDFLLSLQSEGMLEAYVFLERYAVQFAPEYVLWKQREPGKIAEYVCRWLLRPESKDGGLFAKSVSPCMTYRFPALESAIPSGASAALFLENLPGKSKGISAIQAKRLQVIGLFNQAIQAHQANKLDQAISLYRQCLAMDQKLSAAHQNLAVIYFNRGNLIQAATHAEMGTVLEPGSASMVYLATQSYIQLQLFDCAAFCIRRALQRPVEANEKAGLLDRLAYVHILTREWDKAERRLQEASQLDGQNPEIRQHIELLKRMRTRPEPSRVKP
jgi:hypothetical protein